MSVVLKAQDAIIGKQVKFTEYEMQEDQIIANGNILSMAKRGKIIKQY